MGEQLMEAPATFPKGMEKLAYIFCGCATVENTWGKVLAELERLDRGEYDENDCLVTHLVDHCGLSEHGTSIRGGWLTDDGKVALAFLRQHGIDWSHGKGRFLDSEGVTHGTTKEED